MNPEREAEPGSKADHDHGGAPHFLPHWMQHHWSVLTVTVAGVALAVGFFGERFLGLPPSVALALYILAYLAGGYDVARAALPALFRGKFDIDLLMVAAYPVDEPGLSDPLIVVF